MIDPLQDKILACRKLMEEYNAESIGKRMGLVVDTILLDERYFNMDAESKAIFALMLCQYSR